MRARTVVCLHKTERRHCIICIGIKRDHVEQKLMAGGLDKNSREMFNFLHIKIQSCSDFVDGKITGIIRAMVQLKILLGKFLLHYNFFYRKFITFHNDLSPSTSMLMNQLT